MECFKCGTHLGPEDTCPKCGIYVRMYKKLIATSNCLYNIGLERAKVRDLSGAADALKMSLQYNKKNIQARNLLGLLYYEAGETVSALSEWVLSKNQQDKDNIADVYLNDVQSNPALLNTINQTIKKYNQALIYCQQDSTDLAVIQLKKILSTNPKLVKAHQLLALLYIHDRKYDLAKKSLRTAEQIDRRNTITMKYLSEINEQSGETEVKTKKRKKKESRVEYHNGNDTIIQPTNLRDNSGFMMIVNILVGLIIGVTATYFLIVPSIRRNLQSDAREAVANADDLIQTKNQDIQKLQDQVSKLTKDFEDAQKDKEESKTEAESYQKLLAAYKSYEDGEADAAKTALENIDADKLDAAAKQLYDSILAEIEGKYLEETYNKGHSEYMQRHYENASQLLQDVVDIDDTYNEGHAVYYLAQSYRILQQYEKAAQLYQKVIDEYPTSYLCQNAKGYLEQVEAQIGQQQ